MGQRAITVLPDRTYAIRIRPRSSDSYGPFSAPIVHVSAASEGPDAPTGLAAVAGVESISLIWDLDTSGSVAYYEIYVDTFDPPTTLYGTVSGTAKVVAGLTPATLYYARIRPVNRQGVVGSYSSVVSATPTAAGGGSDGNPPSSSPTPTIQGGVGFLLARWTEISNADPVTYEVHISTTTGFTPSGATKSGEIDGTFFFIRKMPDGSALEYGTTYYVKIIATDEDGSAAAGTQGSGSLVNVTTGAGGDLAVDSITAASGVIADATIGTAEIIDLAVTNAKINDLSVDKLTAGTLSADVTVTGLLSAPATTGWRTEIGDVHVPVLHRDDTGSDITSTFTSLSGWIYTTGWSVSGGQAFLSSAADDRFTARLTEGAGNHAPTEYQVECDITLSASAADAGVSFGVADGYRGFWFAAVRDGSNDKLVLGYKFYGTDTFLDSVSSVGLVLGNTYNLRVYVSSDEIRCYLDDVLKITYNPSDTVAEILSNAAAGLYSNNDTTSRFDNFAITDRRIASFQLDTLGGVYVEELVMKNEIYLGTNATIFLGSGVQRMTIAENTTRLRQSYFTQLTDGTAISSEGMIDMTPQSDRVVMYWKPPIVNSSFTSQITQTTMASSAWMNLAATSYIDISGGRVVYTKKYSMGMILGA